MSNVASVDEIPGLSRSMSALHVPSGPTHTTLAPTPTPPSGSTPLKQAQRPGTGVLHLSTPHPRSRFTTSLASYPLKLLSPSPLPSQPPNLALAYTLAYGGGLVAGDIISLAVTLDEGSAVVLLTQGSTKVFKARAGLRPQSYVHEHARDGRTRQRMHVKLAKGCLAMILPDSISVFRGSQYVQSQRFVLPSDRSSSVLVLDWVNSGRGQQGDVLHSVGPDGKSAPASGAETPPRSETWSMESYTSTNEIMLDEKLVMRDKMHLVNPAESVSSTAQGLSPMALQLAPYHVYATVLIYGPHLVPLLNYLRKVTDETTQFQLRTPPGLTWSYSDIPCDDRLGGILRLASESVQDVRTWLRGAFENGGIKDLVGDGLWPRVI